MSYIDNIMVDIKSIGNEIRVARKMNRLTQEELALIASVSRFLVNRLENGSGNVQMASLLKITEALGLEVKISWKAPKLG